MGRVVVLLLLVSACAPCPCGKPSHEVPGGRIASGPSPADVSAPGSEAADVSAPGSREAAEVAAGDAVSAEPMQSPAPEARAEELDPKTALLTHLGRLDEAAAWKELTSAEIEGGSDRVIAFRHSPPEPEEVDDEDDLPMVTVEIVVVTGDGAVHPLQHVEHRMYACEDVEVYASPLPGAPQVLWLDVSCRSGEDYWSIEVDSSLHHRPSAGNWTKLWEGSQAVSGQWTACRDARELDIVVRDGTIVVDELRYRHYTPEPNDHVKRSDCPPKKLRRTELARLPVPAA